MLPVCAATPTCSSHSQALFYGRFWHLNPSSRFLKAKPIEDVFGLSNLSRLQGASFEGHATKSLNHNIVGSAGLSETVTFFSCSSCGSMLRNLKRGLLHKWNYPVGDINGSIESGELKFVENIDELTAENELVDFTGQLNENGNYLSPPDDSVTVSTPYAFPESPTAGSNLLDMDSDALSNSKSSIEDFFGGFNESIGSAVNKGESSVQSLLDMIKSSVTSTTKSANEAVDSAVSELLSRIDQVSGKTSNGLSSLSSNASEALGNAGTESGYFLRQTIVAFENYLNNGANFVVFSYGSAKKFLPPDFQTSLTKSEEQAVEILGPVGTGLQQVYAAVEGLERGLGLDPHDPLVPFFLFFGTSAALWVFYLVWTYGGYSGDLSPKSTLDLLTGKENVVLIDVRPEDLRERDGVPDLRRAARFRYANVTVPQMNDSLKKLLNSGRELDDALLAVVIRNLRSVQDRSKVIVMDADGTRSKGIARSLRKFGIKKSYLVQGGFQSWVRQGLRIKELKPETAITILNEEAEAILEDIRLTPLKLLAFGMGFFSAVYALFEWEKALQLIGVIGLGQTVYRRLSSYKDSADFKQDLRLLLAPARLGAEAFSWAAGKLESNRNGLPTSPLSSDVKSRVLQAAAKHESQPSDVEELKDPAVNAGPLVSDNVDLSDA